MRPLVPLAMTISCVACSSSGARATGDGVAPADSAVPSSSDLASAGSGSTSDTNTSNLDGAETQLSTSGSDNNPSASAGEESVTTEQHANSTAASSDAPASDPTATNQTDEAQPFPDGSPSEMDVAPVPSVRQEHAVVALGDEIYVLGGFTPSATATVQAYAPATDTWRDIADFPVAFHHPNAGAIDGKIYVAGFLLGSSLSDGDGRVFAYDPSDDAWTPRMTMPPGTDRGSACVTTLQSKLYVFGGASTTTVPDASAYDTTTDTWEQLTFMPELREHCVAATVGGLIYIVSGRAGSIGGVDPASFVYNPVTDTYDERAPIPTPRGGTAGALLHGQIFVFGGEGNTTTESGVFSDVEAYNPATDTWQSYPAMTIPRHGFGAATLGDRIYLPGGGTQQGFGSVDSHTAFTFAP